MDKVEELYQEILEAVERVLEHADPLTVAAITSNIGLSIYKTILDEQDFKKMLNVILTKSDEIAPFDQDDSPTIH